MDWELFLLTARAQGQKRQAWTRKQCNLQRTGTACSILNKYYLLAITTCLLNVMLFKNNCFFSLVDPILLDFMGKKFLEEAVALGYLLFKKDTSTPEKVGGYTLGM